MANNWTFHSFCCEKLGSLFGGGTSEQEAELLTQESRHIPTDEFLANF